MLQIYAYLKHQLITATIHIDFIPFLEKNSDNGE